LTHFQIVALVVIKITVIHIHIFTVYIRPCLRKSFLTLDEREDLLASYSNCNPVYNTHTHTHAGLLSLCNAQTASLAFSMITSLQSHSFTRRDEPSLWQICCPLPHFLSLFFKWIMTATSARGCAAVGRAAQIYPVNTVL